MRDNLGDLMREWLRKAKKKDFQAFAKLLTLLERGGTEGLTLTELRNPDKAAFRIGITGPPGAGKSTLIGQLIGELRKRQLTVGILAVDPSSPFTQGAILGDRIRYADHFNDPEVFIRSIGSRGSLGGLSAAAYLMLRAYDVVGFDVVLIETVGVGQTELEVMHVADFVSVVLVPESGDAIQAMKAGLLEIADQFVVNKSDRPGAESLVRELEASLQMGGQTREQRVTVMQTIATEGDGLSELADFYLVQKSAGKASQNRTNPERLQWEARALLRAQFEQTLEKAVSQILTPDDLLKVIKKN